MDDNWTSQEASVKNTHNKEEKNLQNDEYKCGYSYHKKKKK